MKHIDEQIDLLSMLMHDSVMLFKDFAMTHKGYYHYYKDKSLTKRAMQRRIMVLREELLELGKMLDNPDAY